MPDIKARDGTTISDGDEGTFTLAYGDAEVAITGTIHRFDQVERVYDEEGIAIGKSTEEHWEITTGDPHHPAVGFLPENVLTKTG